MNKISTERANEIMLAHQYLYYVLNMPIWSDYQYDAFCKKHNLNSIGGSDRVQDYSEETINLVLNMLDDSTAYSYEFYK